MPGARERRRLRVFAEAQPLQGGPPLRDDVDLTIEPTAERRLVTRDWALAPGVWQARVVVEEPEAGRLGSVLHSFEVPDPEGSVSAGC